MKDYPFCYDNIKDRVVAEQNSVVAILDNYPVTDGHLLIVPKRHMEDYFAMNKTEKKDIGVLIMKLKGQITESSFYTKVFADIHNLPKQHRMPCYSGLQVCIFSNQRWFDLPFCENSI
jgi:diadenosine tetraphosphate (Ap4A) HIT family hydrolase